jgi:anthraniloyl-CoA monooxygenase
VRTGIWLSAFITPLSNQRQDSYGGSVDNRVRFPIDVFKAVRAALARRSPMSVRVSAT